jgi:hypothetical protein
MGYIDIRSTIRKSYRSKVAPSALCLIRQGDRFLRTYIHRQGSRLKNPIWETFATTDQTGPTAFNYLTFSVASRHNLRKDHKPKG